MERDWNFDLKTQAIINKSPILTIFFDRSAETDPQIWLTMLAPEVEATRKEMEAEYGDLELLKLNTIPIAYLADSLGLFAARLDQVEKVGITTLLVSAGYQIAENADIATIVVPVVIQLIKTDMLGGNSEEHLDRNSQIVLGILNTGSLLRALKEGRGDEIEPDQIPDVFKDFFKNKLDDL